MPKITERNLLVEYDTSNVTLENLTMQPVTIGEPVTWLALLNNTTNILEVKYQTPPINLDVQDELFGASWTKKMRFYTEYSGVYEDIIYRGSFPLTDNISIEVDPEVEYYLIGDEIIFSVPEINKEQYVTFTGVLPHIVGNNQSANISTSKGLFVIETPFGNVEDFNVIENNGFDLDFSISDLVEGQETEIVIKMPFALPENFHYYFWKSSSGNGIDIPHKISKSRDSITFYLKDGLFDSDNEENGIIIGSIRIISPNYFVDISRPNDMTADVYVDGKEFSVKTDTGKLGDVNIVEPESVGAPLNSNHFIYKLLKFNVKDLTQDNAKITFIYDDHIREPKLWKFNPNTLAWYRFPYTAVNFSTIEITLTDGGFGDDDGLKNGVINDDIGITFNWWDLNWNNRETFYVHNKLEKIDSAYVKVDLNYGTFNFSNANPDLSDLRFTLHNIAENTESKLDYWLESNKNERAIAWINLPNIERNENMTIYAYSGNENAENESNASISAHIVQDYLTEQNGFQITIFNNSLQNQTENLTQLPAVINEPVKWVKKVKTFDSEQIETITELPVRASKINIKKKLENETVNISEYEYTLRYNDDLYDTKNFDEIKEKTKRDKKNLVASFRRTIGVEKLPQIPDDFDEKVELILFEPMEEYEISYETEAPIAIEEEITDTKKKVTVSSEWHYKEVTAYTNVPESPSGAVKLYWETDVNETDENNQSTIVKKKVRITDFISLDTNNNGFIDQIQWQVPHLSNQTYEVDITVLNVQSYPEIGGTWTVDFTTTGIANLTIQATDGTTWTNNENNEVDLNFINLTCGDNVQTYSWVNNSVFIENYDCNQTSKETSKVVTAGKHAIKFTFGEDSQIARNLAGKPPEVILLRGATGDMNQVTDRNISWGTQDRVDTNSFSHSTGSDQQRVTVLQDGVYRINYGLYITTSTSDSNDRYQAVTHIVIDDQNSGACYDSGYNRGSSSSLDLVTSSECLLELTAGQNITLVGRRESDDGAVPSPVITAANSWLHVQKVDNPNVLILRDTVAGQSYSGIEANITFDQVDRKDSYYEFTANGYEITLPNSGLYRLTYGVGVTHSSGTRSSASGNLMIKPSGGSYADIPYGWSHANQRASQNTLDAAVSASTILNITAGDKIALKVKNASNNLVASFATVADRVHLDIEYLGKENLANVLRIYDSTGLDDIEPGPTDHEFDTKDMEGSDFLYTANTNNFTVQRTGLYHISYGIYTENHTADGNRFEWVSSLRVNGAVQNVCYGSGYNRGSSTPQSATGASESSCFIELNAGDNVTVRSTETSSTTNTVLTAPSKVWLTAQSMDDADSVKPDVINLTVNPHNQEIGKPISLTVNITDEWGVDTVKAMITLLNGTQYNLTMTDPNSDDYYNVTIFNVTGVGRHNITIWANDTSFNNINNTINASINISYASLVLTTDKQSYLRNEVVYIEAEGFNALENVTVTLYDTQLDPLTSEGYPKNVTTNVTGGISDSWTIPGAQILGTYIANATDVTDATRNVEKTFDIVTAVIQGDETSYEQGNWLNMSGYNWDVGENVTVNITDPNGNLVYGNLNLTANSTGWVNDTYFFDYNATVGTYTIGAIEPAIPAKTDTYTFDVIARPTNITKNYNWLIQLDELNISGTGYSPNDNVTIDIFNESGISISGYPKNLTSNITGGINNSWTVPNGQLIGTYTVNLTDYNYPNLKNSTTVLVVEQNIYTDSAAYSADDTVTINGNYWQRNSNVTVEIRNSTGTMANGFPINYTTDINGNFSGVWIAQPGSGFGPESYNISAVQYGVAQINDSTEVSVTRAASLFTDETYYDIQDVVNISGNFYNPSGNVNLTIICVANGKQALNYPITVTANSTGSINHEWNTSDYCSGDFIVKTVDLTYPDLLSANTTFNIISSDFKIQRGYSTIPLSGTGVTITAGADYEAPAAINKSFIRIIGTRLSGVGHDNLGGQQPPNIVMASIENPENLLTSTTFRRYFADPNNVTRVYWEIIEYVGADGGDNEFIVRNQTEITSSGTTQVTGVAEQVADDNDVVVFITGQRHNSATASTMDRAIHTAEWLPASNQPRFTRRDGTGDSDISYAVVEFTGNNWKIQNVSHTISAADTIELEKINELNDVSRGFLHVQTRSTNGNLDEQSGQVWLYNESHVAFKTRSGAATVQIFTAWVIENNQTDGSPLVVNHYSGSRASGGAEPDQWNASVTEVARMNRSSIMGETADSTGGGTYAPRGSVGLLLENKTTVHLWRTDTGQTQDYRYSIVEWPGTAKTGCTEFDVVFPNVTAVVPQDIKYDANQTIELAANVTDNLVVDKVFMNIVYPNSTTQLVELTQATGAKYNTSYTIPNLRGLYNITVQANDTWQNLNNTITTNLSVRVFTTLVAADMNISDFTFVSSTYEDSVVRFFNTSAPSTTIYLFSAFNIKKETGTLPTEVNAKFLVDDATLFVQNGTLQTFFGERVSSMDLVSTTVGPGEHNLTIQTRRLGDGLINITDMDMIFLQLESGEGFNVQGNEVQDSYTHNSTTFIAPYNWTVDHGVDNTSVFYLYRQTLQADGYEVGQYYAGKPEEPLDAGDSSPFWVRSLANQNDFGTAMGMKIDEFEELGDHNQTIFSRSLSGNNVNITLTHFDVNLRDDYTNMINYVYESHPMTNITNNVTYTAGMNNVANKSVRVYNGTGYLLAVTASVVSTTGTQTPSFIVNATDVPEDSCYSKKERLLSSNTDYASIFNYVYCDGLTPGNNYTFAYWINVGAGESLVLLDESMAGFELSPMDTSTANLAPLESSIIIPEENSYQNGMINITWNNFTDPNGDSVLYNITLYNASGILYSILNESATLNYEEFNTQTVADGNWTLRVEARDPSNATSISYPRNFTIDNIPPEIENITPINVTYQLGDEVEILLNTSDFNGVGTVIAMIKLPNGTMYNVTMTDPITNDVYNATFSNTAPVLGLYNITIFANDTINNVNSTEVGNFTVNLRNLSFTTDGIEYVRLDYIFINGTGFNPLINVTLDIKNSTGISPTGFPLNVTSNITGGINYTWQVPADQNLGFLTINATDTTEPSINASTSVEIVTAIIKGQKTVYEQGELFNLTGYNWDFDENVTVNITNPNGELIYGNLNLTSNATGFINDTFYLDYNETIGNYTIQSYEPNNLNKFDNFTFEVIGRPVNMTTQFLWYKINELVNITGTGYSPNDNVTIYVRNSTGDLVSGYPKNVTSNSTGGINETWTVASNLATGFYTINATDYNYPNLNNITSIEIVQQYIETDASAYSSGEVVYITGYYWQRDANVTVNIVNSTQINVSGYAKNVTADSNGSFTDSWISQAGQQFGPEQHNVTAYQYGDENINDSVSIDVTRVATLVLDNIEYGMNEIVNATGEFYNVNGNVSLNLTYLLNGGTTIGYPLMLLSDGAGDIQNEWNTSNFCNGTYRLHTIDQTYPEALSANKTFEIVYLAANTSLDSPDDENVSGDYTLIGGSYVNATTDDGTYLYAGSADTSSVFQSWINLSFDINALGVPVHRITEINFTIEYCHSGAQVNPKCGQTFEHEGNQTGLQDVEIFNFSSGAWVDIGDLPVDDVTDNVNIETFRINSNVTDFFNNNITNIRFEVNFNQTGAEDDALLIDYVSLNLSHGSPYEQSCRLFDAVNPTLNLTTPTNVTYNETTQGINVTGNENISTCVYSVDSGSNNTMTAINESYFSSTEIFSEGERTVTVYCNDTVNLWSEENVTIKIDVTKPTINLIEPTNANSTNVTTHNFTCEVYDNLDVNNVTLYGNFSTVWIANETNTSEINYTNYTFEKTMSDGKYAWNCYVCDDVNCAYNETENYSITIDSKVPEITITDPADFRYNVSYIDFNFTITDLDVDSCWYNFDGGANSSISNCQNTSLTGLTDGLYNLTFYSNDTAGNQNVTYRNFSVAIPKNVTVRVENISQTEDQNATIEIYEGLTLITKGIGSIEYDLDPDKIYDIITTTNISSGQTVLRIRNVTIDANGTITQQINENYTDPFPWKIIDFAPIIAVNVSYNFNFTEIVIPKNGVNVTHLSHCTDWTYATSICNAWEVNATSDYEFTENSTAIIFNVSGFDGYGGGEGDTVPPIINHTNATPNETTRDKNITIFANVTDNYRVDIVLLELNGTNYTMINNTADIYQYEINTSDYAPWFYNYTIFANDTNDNNATPLAGNFTVYQKPDLIIRNITFSDTSFVEGKQILVYVNISNVGGTRQENFTVELNVSLWNETKTLNQSLQSSIQNLSIGETKLVGFDWTVKPGTFIFDALVDNNSNVNEWNKSNNNYTLNITTSVWEMLYGVLNYSVILADSSNQNFMNWTMGTPSGNLYYSDFDASYIPFNLDALDGLNDLSDADSALGITGFNDSIKRLFDKDDNDVADYTMTLEISGNTISDIPVINSSLNSNFVTGLLYDTGDGGGYDGSQDLIIVTVINASASGQYGTYDYEVIIPSFLGELSGAIDSVQRLAEVK